MRVLSCLAALLAAGACLAQAAPSAPVATPHPGTPWVRAGEGAPARDASSMGRTDRSFIEQAAQSQLAVIAFGQLAAQRTRNARVRDYAQRLVTDQEGFHARLQQIAAAKGVALPGQLARNRQSDLRDLQRAQGDAFDQRFLDRMVRDHQKAMNLLAHEIKGRHQDGDLKNFAQDTIIVVQRDFGAAQALRKDSGHLPGG